MHFRKTRTSQVKKANQRHSRPEEENSETDFHLKAFAGPYGAEKTRQAQRDLFRIHLKAAKAAKLPIIIHTREAEDDTIALLEEEKSPDLTGVLHCFSSERRLAEKGLELGFYLSASGIITFKSAQALRDVFSEVPSDRLLLETDAPYLAPVPYRGRKNEPAYMIKTAEMLASLKGVEMDELQRRTTENFFTLFSKAQIR